MLTFSLLCWLVALIITAARPESDVGRPPTTTSIPDDSTRGPTRSVDYTRSPTTSVTVETFNPTTFVNTRNPTPTLAVISSSPSQTHDGPGTFAPSAAPNEIPGIIVVSVLVGIILCFVVYFHYIKPLIVPPKEVQHNVELMNEGTGSAAGNNTWKDSSEASPLLGVKNNKGI